LESSNIEAGCDGLLEMMFSVSGTYLGCEDTSFPGLFSDGSTTSSSTTETTTAEEARGGVNRIRQLIEDKLQEQSTKIQNDVQSLLLRRGSNSHRLHRNLEEETMNPLEGTCGADCPRDAASLGRTVPSSDVLIEVLDPFVRVLEPVCGIISVTVPDSDNEQ
jgi:hypothetical protein